MNKKAYIAVDPGASSGRVLVGLYDGSALSLEEVHRFPTTSKETEKGFQWVIDDIFREIKAGLGKAVSRYRDSLVSIGVDTWGVD